MKIEISSRDGKYKFYTDENNIQTVHDIKNYITKNLKIEKSTLIIFYKDSIVEDTECISSFDSLILQFTFENTSVNKEEIEEDQNIILEDIVTEDKIKVPDIKLDKHMCKLPNIKFDKDICKIQDIKPKEYILKVQNDTINLQNDTINLQHDTIKVQHEKIKIKLKDSGTILEVDKSQTFIKNNKRYLIQTRRKVINFNQIVEQIKKIKISRDDIIKILAFTMLIVTNNSEILFILSTVFFLQMISKVFIKSYRNYSRTMTHYSRTFVMFLASLLMIDHSGF